MPVIEVSNGELLDRVSVLEIKRARLSASVQLSFVESELQGLLDSANSLLAMNEVARLYESLMRTNQEIWDGMQFIYDTEAQWNEQLMHVTLSIIELNKRRAQFKRDIDVATGSNQREAKTFFEE